MRDLQVADFAAAMAFANRVAEAAEAADHHPDILVHGWNKVRLTLSTHSEGGITAADLALAETIDEPRLSRPSLLVHSPRRTLLPDEPPRSSGSQAAHA